MSPDPSRIPDEFARRLVGHVDTIVHLYCRLLPGHDQQDVAQDALTALVEGWRAGSCPAEPLSWLVAVVRKIHARRCRVRWRDRDVMSLCAWHLEDDAAMGIASASDADPWAELRQILDDVTPPFSEADKVELIGLAAGDGRRELARDRGESVRAVERRLKKNLERLSFLLAPGKRREERVAGRCRHLDCPPLPRPLRSADAERNLVSDRRFDGVGRRSGRCYPRRRSSAELALLQARILGGS